MKLRVTIWLWYGSWHLQSSFAKAINVLILDPWNLSSHSSSMVKIWHHQSSFAKSINVLIFNLWNLSSRSSSMGYRISRHSDTNFFHTRLGSANGSGNVPSEWIKLPINWYVITKQGLQTPSAKPRLANCEIYLCFLMQSWCDWGHWCESSSLHSLHILRFVSGWLSQ